MGRRVRQRGGVWAPGRPGVTPAQHRGFFAGPARHGRQPALDRRNTQRPQATTPPAGVGPCHVGGTDIAPTSQALPKPADIAAPRPRMASSAMRGLGRAGMPTPTAMAAAAGAPRIMPMPMPMGAGAGTPGGMMGCGGASSHVLQKGPSVVPWSGV
jgi:hypothetical protein